MYIDPIILTQRQISSEIVKQTDDEIVYEIQHQLGIDIDKGELIKALNYDRNQYNVGYSDGKRAGYQEALEEKNEDWIPFSKELPPKGEKVLLSTFGIVTIGERTSEVDEALRLSILDPMNNMYKNIDRRSYQITHWQPLPKSI